MGDPIRDSNDDDVGIPRWVRALGIIAVVVIVLFAILHFSFGGPLATACDSHDDVTQSAQARAYAHVTSTVGWLGAIAEFLALAIAALTSRDMQLVRGTYLAMEA